MGTRVTYGPESEEDNLAGRTISEIRQLYENECNIPPDSTVLVNGKQIEDEGYQVKDEDKVEFSNTLVKGLPIG